MDGIQLRTKSKYQQVRHLPWMQTKGLESVSVEMDARYGHIIRCQNYEGLNMSLNLHTELLTVRGSIQTFSKGCNYEGFTYTEFKEGVGSLADVLNCKPIDLAVINSEISATIQHIFDCNALSTFAGKPFLPMKKLGTNRVYGADCLLDEYGFKMYNKTLERKLRREAIARELLQVEFLIRSRRYYGNKYLCLPNPTLQDLLRPEVFKASYDYMIAKTDEIQLNTAIDWAYLEGKHDLSPSELIKVRSLMDPSLTAHMKKSHPETYKNYKRVFDRVKGDLSESSTGTMTSFKQALIAEVERKYDW